MKHVRHLQNSIGHRPSDVVEVVLYSIGRESGNSDFHVIGFVVDGQVEAALRTTSMQ